MRQRRYVYAIHSPAARSVKIGFSAFPQERLKLFQEGHCEPLQLLAKVTGARGAEQRLHWRLRDHRMLGEWCRECPEVMAVVGELAARQQREERATKNRRHRHRAAKPPAIGVVVDGVR